MAGVYGNYMPALGTHCPLERCLERSDRSAHAQPPLLQRSDGCGYFLWLDQRFENWDLLHEAFLADFVNLKYRDGKDEPTVPVAKKSSCAKSLLLRFHCRTTTKSVARREVRDRNAGAPQEQALHMRGSGDDERDRFREHLGSTCRRHKGFYQCGIGAPVVI